MAKRGQFTPEVEKIMSDFLGRGTSRVELRLIPYIQHVMVNDQRLDPGKISQDERDVVAKWRAEGHFEGGMTGCSVTPAFWDFMCQVLMVAYVDYRNRSGEAPE